MHKSRRYNFGAIGVFTGRNELDKFLQDRPRYISCKADKASERTLIHSAQIEKKQFHACVALGDELEKVSLH